MNILNQAKATVDDRYPSLIDLITVKLIAAPQAGVSIIYVAVRVEAPYHRHTASNDEPPRQIIRII